MRLIIAAAGQGKRWNNYRNVPKHLVNIEGEILLNRIVRQFSKYTNDIIVIGRDDRYLIDGSTLEYPIDGEWYDFGKIYSSNHLWSENRTIIVFGDVYFTDDAVLKIVNDNNDYRFFMRTGPSKVTRKNHKEIFAVAFNANMNNKIKTSIEALITRKTTGGAGAWQLYLYMHGKTGYAWNMKMLLSSGGYTEINDWTDDFDTPQDINNWEKRRLKFGAK